METRTVSGPWPDAACGQAGSLSLSLLSHLLLTIVRGSTRHRDGTWEKPHRCGGGSRPDIRAVTLACQGGNRIQGKFLSTLFCIAPSNKGLQRKEREFLALEVPLNTFLEYKARGKSSEDIKSIQ